MERSLLLVDDDNNVLSSLKRALRKESYIVWATTSVDEATEILDGNNIGVVISDQRMPDMLGTDFLNEVKNRHPNTIRMILSGYSDLKTVIDAINHGAIYKYITKPWEDDALKGTINEAFDKYELQAENARLTAELQLANEKLTALNKGLESRVEEKTRELKFHLNALMYSHGVMEALPVAVLGVDDRGEVVLTNHEAKAILSDVGRGLMGMTIKHLFSEDIVAIMRKAKIDEPVSRNVEINGIAGQLLMVKLGNKQGQAGWVMTFVRENPYVND